MIKNKIPVFFVEKNQEQISLMDEVDENLVICINVRHPYYENIASNGTSEKEMEFKVNCVFDALSELHNKNKYGKYSPEDIRLTKDLFLKRWIQSFMD